MKEWCEGEGKIICQRCLSSILCMAWYWLSWWWPSVHSFSRSYFTLALHDPSEPHHSHHHACLHVAASLISSPSPISVLWLLSVQYKSLEKWIMSTTHNETSVVQYFKCDDALEYTTEWLFYFCLRLPQLLNRSETWFGAQVYGAVYHGQ